MLTFTYNIRKFGSGQALPASREEKGSMRDHAGRAGFRQGGGNGGGGRMNRDF